jgi:Fe-S cluster biosynthesis and repair protein YggX
LDITGSNINTIISKFTKDFQQVQNWIEHNQLKINYKKTNIMAISSRNIIKPDFIEIKYKKEFNNIKIVNEVILLVITLDEKLRFPS